MEMVWYLWLIDSCSILKLNLESMISGKNQINYTKYDI